MSVRTSGVTSSMPTGPRIARGLDRRRSDPFIGAAGTVGILRFLILASCNRHMKKITASILIAISAVLGVAQSTVRDYRVGNEQRLLEQFVEFLSLPNVASDT